MGNTTEISRKLIGSFLAVCMLIGCIQNGGAKSFKIKSGESTPIGNSSETTDDSDITNNTTPVYTPTTSTSPTKPIPQIELNVSKPNRKLNLSSKSVPTKFILGENETNSNFFIAVHLEDCKLNGGKSEIHLSNEAGDNWTWYCQNGLYYDEQYSEESETWESSQVSVDRKTYTKSHVKVMKVLDGLTDVLITSNLQDKTIYHEATATIIINIYKDPSEESCPENYFNCRKPACPQRCCSSDYPSGKNYYDSSPNEEKSITFFNIFSNGKPSGQGPRCIHKSLVCNDQPNCGLDRNIDEADEVCSPQNYCQCQALCLTWNYVLTSLAIAVLFIITPTAIVFALFHRRNVALERARLLRLAHARMADMRGELTREASYNDFPPSYDDIYDTKEPPPCFCQAVGTVPMDQHCQLVEAQRTTTDEEQVQEETNCSKCSCKSNSNNVAAGVDDPGKVQLSSPPTLSQQGANASAVEIGIDASEAIRNPNSVGDK